ncbi:hypothetical protein FCM35_KLT09655 [Carex littledalei]|uniref:Uncharacterized protein n=1 Tax=Carex littledalei TaxID=544730 RepID=A0A833VK28_9POAL|nr:hypothetical protein FCM35_KLT09655 [Carex littledalei]
MCGFATIFSGTFLLHKTNDMSASGTISNFTTFLNVIFHNSGIIKSDTCRQKYRQKFISLIHAVLSVLVFFAVAFRDKNVISCFYPNPWLETQEFHVCIDLINGSYVFVALVFGLGIPYYLQA